jgi:mono/diheme cytochrome c family protein
MRCWNALVLVAALAAAGTGPARAETPVERGRYLVTAIAACGNCHTPHDAANRELPGMELAGGREFDDAELGHIVGPNITPDRETGIGAWSAAQIVTALRTGRRPDGTLIAPPMPIEFYRGLGDRDAEAIAAYVKSLKPVHHAVARSHYRVPLPPSYGPEVAHVAEPDRGDKVAYGAYLAGPVAHCMECHTPRIRGVLQRDRLGAGGRELPDIGHPGALTVQPQHHPRPRARPRQMERRRHRARDHLGAAPGRHQAGRDDAVRRLPSDDRRRPCRDRRLSALAAAAARTVGGADAAPVPAIAGRGIPAPPRSPRGSGP